MSKLVLGSSIVGTAVVAMAAGIGVGYVCFHTVLPKKDISYVGHARFYDGLDGEEVDYADFELTHIGNLNNYYIQPTIMTRDGKTYDNWRADITSSNSEHILLWDDTSVAGRVHLIVLDIGSATLTCTFYDNSTGVILYQISHTFITTANEFNNPLLSDNLLREGLDLPEVALVAIMDADKEGFLRSERSLTQTAGRAARHAGGNVILYAERRTDSMRAAIAESNRRREKQITCNMRNAIIPHAAQRSGNPPNLGALYQAGASVGMVAEPRAVYTTRADVEREIIVAREMMEQAARELDFTEAARHRDRMYALQEQLKEHRI